MNQSIHWINFCPFCHRSLHGLNISKTISNICPVSRAKKFSETNGLHLRIIQSSLNLSWVISLLNDFYFFCFVEEKTLDFKRHRYFKVDYFQYVTYRINLFHIWSCHKANFLVSLSPYTRTLRRWNLTQLLWSSILWN